MSSPNLQSLDYQPLSKKNWPQLQQLFGERGACGGCWCMHWRLTNKEYERNKGSGNKQLFYDLIISKAPLGILAFFQGEPIAWCSVSPRDSLPRLETSRILKRVDNKPVWSITCLFLKKEFRRKGLSKSIIKAACDYAKAQGASIIEAYPIIPKKEKMPDAFAWVGFANAFEQAGFEAVAQPSETRLYMRYQ